MPISAKIKKLIKKGKIGSIHTVVVDDSDLSSVTVEICSCKYIDVARNTSGTRTVLNTIYDEIQLSETKKGTMITVLN